MNTYDIPNEPRKLYNCHGGNIITAQTSPISPHIMTLGRDGKIFVYNYESKELLLEKKFSSKGTDLLWFNTKISACGYEMVASFEDGIIRQFLLDMRKKKEAKMHLVKSIKAHTAPVTKLSINSKYTTLVSGAADQTIFVYQFGERSDKGFVTLIPMGFVQITGIPYSLNWKMEDVTASLFKFLKKKY